MNSDVSIVTGGSSGLGYEISGLLVEGGNNVCIVGRNSEKLARAKAGLEAINNKPEVVAFQGNIGREDDVESLFEVLNGRGMRISRIFNVAGIGIFCACGEINGKMIEDVFEANLIGMILMCANGLRAMRENGGTIINVMSTAAMGGRAGKAVYCASKWGARGFTESLRFAVEGTNIKVVSVYPGGMDTEFWNNGTGLNPDVSKFMNPRDVARNVMAAVDAGLIREMVIDGE